MKRCRGVGGVTNTHHGRADEPSFSRETDGPSVFDSFQLKNITVYLAALSFGYILQEGIHNRIDKFLIEYMGIDFHDLDLTLIRRNSF